MGQAFPSRRSCPSSVVSADLGACMYALASVRKKKKFDYQKRVSVKQRVRDTVSGHISLSAYEQVATSRFMCKDHQKQPDVTRKGHPPLSSVPHEVH